jgi:hypothetical protein
VLELEKLELLLEVIKGCTDELEELELLLELEKLLLFETEVVENGAELLELLDDEDELELLDDEEELGLLVVLADEEVDALGALVLALVLEKEVSSSE